MANVISMAKKIAVISALVEGCSVRSTVRLTGVSKGAVLRLLESVGAACQEYQDRVIHNVSAKRVQVDEIWSYCYCKQKNITQKIADERIAGDVWTFTAIDAETKLVISWAVGQRDAGFASYVERQNLNMRMNMRRFTRLTNAFSKKLENHIAMIALFHMHYNFARVHQTLRVTPAMEAGLSSHVWSIQEIVSLISMPVAQAA